MLLQQVNDPPRVLLRFRRRRQNPEPRRQHLLPINSDLPGPRLVGEEDDVVPGASCFRSKYLLTIVLSLAGGNRSMASINSVLLAGLVR
jgi:hypothetical protein